MALVALGVVKQSCKLRICSYPSTKCLIGNSSLLMTPRALTAHAQPLHTTESKLSLMEFFDDEKNWGERTVKVGRSWKMDDLRIKSNSDLHKLWYVLLKERNMLMSMEHECYEEYEYFANPERLDKVKESMHNLEEVIIERNKAFHELETGETGLRPSEHVINQIGLPLFHRKTEHWKPKFLNTKWKARHIFKDVYEETKLFHARLKEVEAYKKRLSLRGQTKHVLGLMRRFPNLDLEAVKEKFPDVDVDKLKQSDKARGHSIP